MRALDKKLVRDLRRMWAQALAIALVMGAGVATIVLAIGAYRSLEETRAAYYERYRFAEVFAEMTRAPDGVLDRVREIPGVLTAEARIKKTAIIDVEGFVAPVSGAVLSLPDHAEPLLNRLHMREGRVPEPDNTREVVIDEAFATAHQLRPGSRFAAVLNGRKRELTVVGVALSPEFIYALGPGDLMPDERRFGVLWMSRKALQAIFDLDGAFNELALHLLPGTSEVEIIRRLDPILARYGSTGAYGRTEQQSHAFLDAELNQLAAMGRVIPPIFLFVSAFLINMTLSRLIVLEREQIGLLKALGYGKVEVAWHYAKLVQVIAVLGVLMGAAAGTWLGAGLARLYGDFFHFPFLIFRRDWDLYALAALVTSAAALLGALKASLEVLALPPAAAMQPPAPPRYRRYLVHRFDIVRALSQLSIMALRNMLKWPVRAALTTLGLAFAVAILVTSYFTYDSVEHMIDVAFFQTDRQHATLNFAEAKARRTVDAVAQIPGVLRAEPYRSVPVRLKNGHFERKLSILGKPEERDLSRVLDLSLVPIALPDDGLVIGERLAELLRLAPGDHVIVEVLENRRQTVSVPVRGVIKSYFGLVAYMDLPALDAMLDDGPRVTGVHIAYDRAQEDQLFAAIKATPAVASIALQNRSLVRFRETLAENINIMTMLYVGLSCINAFGVVYNSARVQLSERARELATLRVLGFTRAEVSRVLLTELALLTLIANPLGWAIGYGFAWLTVQGFANDLYRVPFVIERATFAKASLIVIIAAALSSFIVRRRVDKFDLVAVLKARD